MPLSARTDSRRCLLLFSGRSRFSNRIDQRVGRSLQPGQLVFVRKPEIAPIAHVASTSFTRQLDQRRACPLLDPLRTYARLATHRRTIARQDVCADPLLGSRRDRSEENDHSFVANADVGINLCLRSRWSDRTRRYCSNPNASACSLELARIRTDDYKHKSPPFSGGINVFRRRDCLLRMGAMSFPSSAHLSCRSLRATWVSPTPFARLRCVS